MKRIFAILLVLALAASLTGCAVLKEEMDLREARELMDAGEYNQAIELLRSMERYQEIQAMLEEAAALAAQADLAERINGADLLFGTWKSIDEFGTSVTFHEDGTCVFLAGTQRQDMDFRFTGSGVESGINFSVTTANGITWLTATDNAGSRTGHRFVREENYATYGPQTIPITLENWEQYFELRPVRQFQFDEAGQIAALGFGYGIYLREEYLSRVFPDPNGYVTLSFTMEYDLAYRYVQNPTDENYSIGGLAVSPMGSSSTETIRNHLNDNSIPTGDARRGAVCALFAGTLELGSRHFPVFEKGAVTEVSGALVLYP